MAFCPICREEVASADVCVLTCGHCVCAACSERLLVGENSENDLQCPTCRHAGPIAVRGLYAKGEEERERELNAEDAENVAALLLRSILRNKMGTLALLATVFTVEAMLGDPHYLRMLRGVRRDACTDDPMRARKFAIHDFLCTMLPFAQSTPEQEEAQDVLTRVGDAYGQSMVLWKGAGIEGRMLREVGYEETRTSVLALTAEEEEE